MNSYDDTAEKPTDESELHECPTCGDGFESEHGVKIHHGRVHNDSLAGEPAECEHCGETFRHQPGDPGRFCSRECYGEWQSDNLTGADNPNGVEPVIIECSSCGDELERAPSRAAVTENHFCDIGCRGEWMSENRRGEDHPNYNSVEKVCPVCENSFQVISAREDEAVHCSRTCMAKGYTGTDVAGNETTRQYAGDCGYCGNDVYRLPCYPDTNRVFCNADCHNTWQREHGPEGADHWNWEGGFDNYGPGWNEEKKEAVRERDGRKCMQCGRTEADHLEKFGRKHSVHHIRKARSVNDPERRNSMDNLVTLCCAKECHKKWEQMAPLRPELPE